MAHDFNGADEDEIMDKVFTKYSTEGKDHNGVKNGIKILLKKDGPKAASVILEATHKLKSSQVPGYIKANFDKAWTNFDINEDGFIKAEETHTFMRSLMGKLNKFALAPGTLSDVTNTSVTQSLVEEAPKPKPKKVAPKPIKKKPVEEVSPEAQADAADAAEAAALMEAGGADTTGAADITALEINQAINQVMG